MTTKFIDMRALGDFIAEVHDTDTDIGVSREILFDAVENAIKSVGLADAFAAFYAATVE
ncbi:hypothetical protein [Sphingomonas sp. GB1N7]|uniref:hypothetical protein n=1 Tax=Parasphingomonas caseinilytica TaxID=3096158 RepID=UPI002FCCAF74